MRYLVCYDIADDRRRDRLAGALLDFGPRLQESVFLLDLDEELLVRLKERVTKVHFQPSVKARLAQQLAELFIKHRHRPGRLFVRRHKHLQLPFPVPPFPVLSTSAIRPARTQNQCGVS